MFDRNSEQYPTHNKTDPNYWCNRPKNLLPPVPVKEAAAKQYDT